MARAIRTPIARAVEPAGDLQSGQDLFASLLGRPLAAAVEPVDPDFAALLARPFIPAAEPIVTAPAIEWLTEPAPPVPMPTGRRVLRTRSKSTSIADWTLAHGELDALLAESIALRGAKRIGMCKICGRPKSEGCPGPFWYD